jgi:hypothetical protein
VDSRRQHVLPGSSALAKYIVSRDIQVGPLLDFIHVPLHLLIPTGRPKYNKEMMNTRG